MAQKIVVSIEDDLDGSQADETIRFALDGVSYEIDLKAEHARQMRDSLSAFVGAARTVRNVKGQHQKSRRAEGDKQGPSPSAVREWAKSQGMKVSNYGRISQSMIEAYTAAN